jgi:predicted metal-dependent hydrolase
VKVEIVRSPRRRKTITAERREGRVVVRLPAGMSQTEERTWVHRRIQRLNARRNLEKTADRLNREYFDGRLRWTSIRYVGNQRDRYGSCTPEDGAIRISDRVAGWPSWVREYVVMHELAHLLVGSHSPRFWRLVERYPLLERARGFLIAKGWED